MEGIAINFELRSRAEGEWMVLDLRGEVDLATAPQLRRGIHDLIDRGHHRIALDLSDVDFMDSTGLGVLIGSLKRIKESDGTLVLAGIRPAVARVFEVTGLDRIFTIHQTLSEIGMGRDGDRES